MYRQNFILKNFNRSVSFGDNFTDRWERAKFHKFGERTSCYDNVLILNNVSVGSDCWIGPNVVLDGSGELTIGNFCHISSGSQVYSHDTVDWVLSSGKSPIIRQATSIGNNCYLGPNVIIQKGVTIGDNVIIGANSLVNKDIPSNSKAFGTPIKIFNLANEK